MQAARHRDRARFTYEVAYLHGTHVAREPDLVAEDVTVDPYICPGCGHALFVRDHFSRRLGAFQGVCIDAETPGDVPEPVEIRL